MDLYKEEVMDHYENPRNRGVMSGENIIFNAEENASCGDTFQFYLKIKAGTIVEAKWEGVGCAISTASASKLSVYLQGQTLKELRKMSGEELLKIAVGFEVNPGRIKCLMLPVKVVKKLCQN